MSRAKKRALVVLMLVVLIAGVGAFGWRTAQSWAPPRTEFPMQGVALSAAQGAVEWGSLIVHNPDFVYIRAVNGRQGRDARFAANLAGAQRAGIRYGAEILFDPCGRASEQATAFLTTVPRDAAALPPAIRLDGAPTCAPAPAADKVVSELNTLINLVEAHMGKPAVLHVSAQAEVLYAISTRLNRTLWLDRAFLKPNYASHGWVMWTANNARRVEGVDVPVEWVVVAD
ncbi:glycoside hydrolase family 25 protein [Sphingobium sp. DEHP117]|uniref:glycoside hydrolase family 25 protein n=1 Tax=Sphingobium sp. DEHP117 TaxID=2993436 RepID=UPI0027D6B899|nr:GH25 family lysozyme [Sphingobium sp. DEHP117]MDQ4419679.1 glycoside hydrolase family 25 protein [Sphingobium sp. DEHP117]